MRDGDLGAPNGVATEPGTGFVEVMFASSRGEAQESCGFLRSCDIPARLEDLIAPDESLGVAVLVPADRIVEASERLATRVQHVVSEDEAIDDDAADDDDDDDEFDDELDDDDDDEFDDDLDEEEEEELGDDGVA